MQILLLQIDTSTVLTSTLDLFMKVVGVGYPVASLSPYQFFPKYL